MEIGDDNGSTVCLCVPSKNKEESEIAGSDDSRGSDRARQPNLNRRRAPPAGGRDQDRGGNNRSSSKGLGGVAMTWLPAVATPKGAAFANWSVEDVAGVVRHHPLPCFLTLSLLCFMGVEYTIRMVPASSPPLDIGFILTQSLHSRLAARPNLNSALAALNTVFVAMQAAYILWTLLVEGRPRATIAALFMFTCRGTLGCATQLPVPQGFLGSGVDFPVGNVSFFLFFSGHVAGAVIASLDMRRMRRHAMAWTFDALNVLQGLRLLAARGHYTIDLAAGVGAGFVFDILAGKYEDGKKQHASEHQRPDRP